ncbi:hypothetical protein [Pararhizobium haloflavum]|uniref:hypothetical protein n=1 Tax=Pararhizobium haloflavum TaxID=2037914 RepID=UPI000C198A15|nr:hypothetical protein [Pararhizobium haloflavum]
MMGVRCSFVLVLVAGLAGCSETTGPPALSPPDPAPMRTGSATDEQACELAVTRQTNNGDVVTLSSDFSQANTEVIVGVGPDRARWRCLVSSGEVAEVMSLTDEGAL